jgi:hypothetical protein
MDRSGLRHTLVPIDGVKARSRLSVIVPRATVDSTSASYSALTNVNGPKKLKDWVLCPAHLREEYGEWTFYRHGTVEWENETIFFLWTPALWNIPVENMTALQLADRRKGLLLSEGYISQSYSWPPVLKDLQVEVPIDDPGTTAARVQPRMIYYDGFNAASPCRVRVYLTDQRPNAQRMQTDEPIPGEVRGVYNGQAISFPECLHPRIEVEDVQATGSRVIDCTPTRSSERPGRKRVFKATNHTEWQDHTFRIECPQVDDPQADLFIITEYYITVPEGAPRIET